MRFVITKLENQSDNWTRIVVTGYLDYPFPPNDCIEKEHRDEANKTYNADVNLCNSIHVGDSEITQTKEGG